MSDPARRALTRSTVPMLLMIALAPFAPPPAAARTSGIVGYSGIEGFACETCHDQEGVPPTLRFEGPAQVDPGAETTYRLVIRSGDPETQVQAGFNVAASGGVLQVIQGQRTRLQSFDGRPELTHSGPKDVDANGEAEWAFVWRAPPTPGEYILFGAGNSVDASFTFAGDASTTTMLVVAVGSIAPSPTPTATPAPTCIGDCNGDGVVAVNELISGVNIALGSVAVAVCTACDVNGDAAVSVSELVSAVSRLLNGC